MTIIQEVGHLAEQRALDYLIRQGLVLVTRNYHCRLGELDLIMRDKEYLVFVEVRLRSGSEFGDGIMSITRTKKQKIIKSTTYFLMKHQLLDKQPIRFDVVSIDGKKGAVTWLKDAFGVDY